MINEGAIVQSRNYGTTGIQVPEVAVPTNSEEVHTSPQSQGAAPPTDEGSPVLRGAEQAVGDQSSHTAVKA